MRHLLSLLEAMLLTWIALVAVTVSPWMWVAVVAFFIVRAIPRAVEHTP